MTIATRYSKSLWSYNPLPHNCVLYLPLWSPDLRGSAFRSIDPFKHECAVVGSTHSGRGRFFDKIDDIITVTKHSSINNLFAGGGTVIQWIDIASEGEGTAGFLFNKDAAETVGWFTTVFGEAAGKVKFQLQVRFTGGGGTLNWSTDDTVITLNEPTMVSVTYNSSSHTNNPIVYINDATVPITRGGTGTGTNKDDSTKDLIIGSSVPTDRTTDGYIREVWNYTEILSASQLSYIFERTRV